MFPLHRCVRYCQDSISTPINGWMCVCVCVYVCVCVCFVPLDLFPVLLLQTWPSGHEICATPLSSPSYPPPPPLLSSPLILLLLSSPPLYSALLSWLDRHSLVTHVFPLPFMPGGGKT